MSCEQHTSFIFIFVFSVKVVTAENPKTPHKYNHFSYLIKIDIIMLLVLHLICYNAIYTLSTLITSEKIHDSFTEITFQSIPETCLAAILNYMPTDLQKQSVTLNEHYIHILLYTSKN